MGDREAALENVLYPLIPLLDEMADGFDSEVPRIVVRRLASIGLASYAERDSFTLPKSRRAV